VDSVNPNEGWDQVLMSTYHVALNIWNRLQKYESFNSRFEFITGLLIYYSVG
jgi:hypothetical protein